MQGFRKNENKKIKKEIQKTHNVSMSLPRSFFLAHRDSAIISWLFCDDFPSIDSNSAAVWC